jgi:PKD repeat protein
VSLAASDINNCSKTVYLDVVVHALPIPMFSYTAGVCDSTINFTESASGNGANISKWVWDFGDGVRQTILSPSVADVSHRYASTGLFKVGLTVTNNFGCTNSMSESNVLVKPCINAKFGISPSLVCQNNSAYFADSSYSGVPVNEWYWEFGDGTDTTYYSYANPVRHVYTTSGTFLAKMKITTFVAGKKASDSTMVRVNVNPTPLPDFAFKNSCHEQNTTFTNLTSGNGTKINNFSWNFGEPSSGTKSTSTQKDPSHLYSSLGAYDVQLKVENTLGCRDSILKTVTIYGLPDANYEYTMSCAGTKTVFTDLSIETVAPLTDWEWTFSDNLGTLGRQNVRNPEFVFDKPGDYTVNLKVTDIHGCTNSVNQQVTTWEVPTSQFVISDNFENVQGQLEFVNLSTDATRYYWSFGDDNYSYSETPVALFQDEGVYDISLVSWNEKGCSDTLTMKYEFVVKSLYVPNAFSPENPKEEVRLFKPVGINIQEYLFEIYDRWGTLIWTSDKLDADGRPTEGWDGTSKGVLLPEGAYVWKAFAIFKDGTIWDGDNSGNNDNLTNTTTGTATLIR